MAQLHSTQDDPDLRRDLPNNLGSSISTKRKLIKRKQTGSRQLYCVPGTKTYIVINVVVETIAKIGSDAAQWAFYMLHDELINAGNQATTNDGVISYDDLPIGILSGVGHLGLSWFLHNADNHQITWGVFDSALTGILTYMQKYGYYVQSSIEIWDGVNQVGWFELKQHT